MENSFDVVKKWSEVALETGDDVLMMAVEEIREKYDSEIAGLEDQLILLQCLEEAGVDNWEGYSYAQTLRMDKMLV